MFSFIKRLFGSTPRSVEPSPTPPTQPVAAPAPADNLPVVEPLWQRLTAQEPSLPAPFPETLAPVAAAVRAHAAQHKPGPSSFPTLAIRIMDFLSQQKDDIHELIQLLSADPAISAQLLRVANSTLYHRGQDVVDLRTAVMKIGLRGVSEIAVGVAGRSLFDVAVRVEYETFPERWQALYHRTMIMAFAASQCSFEQHCGKPDQVFLGGMFIDIGKTLALRSLARLIVDGRTPADLSPTDVDALLENLHTDLGAEALQSWGLPAHLVEWTKIQHQSAVDSEVSHLLRVTDGALRFLQDPEDLTYLEQTRHSFAALHMHKAHLRMVLKALLEQQTRVPLMFPG